MDAAVRSDSVCRQNPSSSWDLSPFSLKAFNGLDKAHSHMEAIGIPRRLLIYMLITSLKYLRFLDSCLAKHLSTMAWSS